MARSENLSIAMSALLTSQPFFAVYLLQMMNIVESPNVQTAATDSRTIWVNPGFFATLTVAERVFVLAHEVWHGIMLHVQRGKKYHDLVFGPDGGKFQPKRWGKACDYVINHGLTEGHVGAMPKGGLYDPKFTSAMQADEVYKLLPIEQDDGDFGQNGTDSPDGDHGGFDQHHLPKPGTPLPSDQEVKQAVAGALSQAKAAGRLPGVLERVFGEVLEPTQNWKDLLRNYFSVRTGRDDVSWQQVNRRKLATSAMLGIPLIMPGKVGHQIGGTVVVVDTSGSISNKELDAFMGELSGILEDATPEWCKVLWVDSVVAGFDDVSEASELVHLKPKGGGGTNMPAAFDWLDKHGIQPETVVILSDLWTPFGTQPHGYDVLWVSTTERTAPYGRTIHLDISK